MAERPFGHEPSGIAVRRVGAVGAVTAIAVTFTVTIVCLVLRERLQPARTVGRETVTAIPPRPRLQAQPHSDLAALRSEKEGVLQSWGWVDHSGKFVHIPIERAMALYVQQHPPTTDAAAATGSSAGGSRQ